MSDILKPEPRKRILKPKPEVREAGGQHDWKDALPVPLGGTVDVIVTTVPPKPKHRSLKDIAAAIRADWSHVPGAAKEFASQMAEIDTIYHFIGNESGESIVENFLEFSRGWQGPVARRVRDELEKMIRDKLKDTY